MGTAWLLRIWRAREQTTIDRRIGRVFTFRLNIVIISTPCVAWCDDNSRPVTVQRFTLSGVVGL
jgi:hypothetical protein